jgi:hypothetical protein
MAKSKLASFKEDKTDAFHKRIRRPGRHAKRPNVHSRQYNSKPLRGQGRR